MNIVVSNPAEEMPPRRTFTAEDVRRMTEAGVLREDEGVELVEGELVMMAAKGYAHEMMKKALAKAVFVAAQDDVDVGVEMTLQYASDLLLEPDIVIFRPGSLTKSDAGFATVERDGCLLVIEVAASSLAYDKDVKSRLYASLGVQELWVVDANERSTWVYSGPRNAEWTSVVKRGAQEVLRTPALPRLAIRVCDVA
jgi:Uma2 family endonuclease